VVEKRVSGFGAALRDEFPLEAGLVYLNHGTVGVTPRRVLDAQEAVRREIETDPARWVLREVSRLVGPPGPARLRDAAERVASFVGARGDDLVFVENATTGINSILRSMELGPGDVVMTTEKTYGGIRQAVRYACRQSGASVSVARVPCPITGPDEVVAVVEEALVPGTKLCILDHIVSEIGVVLPVERLVASCRAVGARVVVDAAHAPGQLDLDVPAIGADAYTGNLHKWALAPRSCAFLWADPQWQPQLHPAVVSWGLDEGFAAEFDWTGTRDQTAALVAPVAIDLLEELGFAEVQRYNHDLLWRAVAEMQGRWGGSAVAPESMSAFMTAFPLPDWFAPSAESAERLRRVLREEHHIEVPVHAWADRLWLRLSVQVYNEMADIERLVEAVELEAGRSAAVKPA
jgi:isopenicillin-N epimerase